MDAKDRLRRYLEQRRELGESELVLDSLSIEDVMKMVGAKSSAPKVADVPATAKSKAPALADRDADAPPPDQTHDMTSAPVTPPPEPGVRFDRGATTDWREALRNAGAMRPSDASSAPPIVVTPSPAAEAAADAANTAAAASTQAMADTPIKNLPAWLSALELPLGIEAGRLRVIDAAPDVASLPTLEEIAEHVAGCTRCALYKSAKHHVLGEGNPQAELLCVGEAPGVHEDEQGRPFVGEAGQLLTKILGAIQLSREEVFICNVLKHRPPGNRDPLPDEVVACQPYLLRQIELVRPRVILALGRFAAQTLLQTTTGIGALRGRIHRFHGVPLIVTYHPAALLRNESWKRPTWEDVKLARRILDASRAASADSTAP
ncbi:uracil-DNA glycosylase [Gemmatimonas sp.]|uniref:uracil-DNA glycosylase n=1 Tax=Gemmatimonas sp. TaxID=1962908 RepID=UPI00286E0A25|nr:uracil-DNA glycosylase [Gemmatimonas sp.]